MMRAGLQEALSCALAVLEQLGLRYALVGGLAVSAWAVPRATRDADLWVALEGRRADLEAALRAGGFEARPPALPPVFSVQDRERAPQSPDRVASVAN